MQLHAIKAGIFFPLVKRSVILKKIYLSLGFVFKSFNCCGKAFNI